MNPNNKTKNKNKLINKAITTTKNTLPLIKSKSKNLLTLGRFCFQFSFSHLLTFYLKRKNLTLEN